MDQKSDQTTHLRLLDHINATPEQVWRGLTEPASTRRYWGGVSFRTDRKKGSTYDVAYGESLVISDPRQVILESDP